MKRIENSTASQGIIASCQIRQISFILSRNIHSALQHREVLQALFCASGGPQAAGTASSARSMDYSYRESSPGSKSAFPPSCAAPTVTVKKVACLA